VTSSFLCENCGIKVTAAEGSECPGCGFGGASAGDSIKKVASDSSDSISRDASFSKLGFNDRYVADHLIASEAKFTDDRPRIDQWPALQEVITSTKEKIDLAPDKESTFRLSSYLSEMYRQAQNYHESIEAGKVGIESNEEFFVHQSHNSILDSLFHLNRFQDFEEWVERALQVKFPDANYYKINYLMNLQKFDEALEVCESHYAYDTYLLNARRSDILVKAQRFEEAEQALNKLIANGPRAQGTANWINTLAFSILIPQKRYHEAERVLISAICTKDQREKTNAFSNLAMLAFQMNEFQAAKRFASKATDHPENAIASESRLTLCRIEAKLLTEKDAASSEDWEKLFDQVKEGLEIADFDDSPRFLELLISAAEKSNQLETIVEVIEKEFERVRTHAKWRNNQEAREKFQRIRIDILSKFHLEQGNYLQLDALFQDTLAEGSSQGFEGLLEYLKTPFAAIDLRRACLKITDVGFLTDWSSFETQDEILYSLAKNSQEPILEALALNEATPDAICELISKQRDLDLDFALCNRPNLTLNLIKVLIKSDFEAVRKLIASRVDLDEETFRTLATDSAMLVRDAIRENSACPAEIRALAALGSL
jgi:tetratricopeptide (TPR) repeat protein